MGKGGCGGVGCFSHRCFFNFIVPRSICVGIHSTQILHVGRCRGRMLLKCQEFRSDVKSILKFNRSNDVLNSKWVSQNSHYFIEQCCVGTPITGFS